MSLNSDQHGVGNNSSRHCLQKAIDEQPYEAAFNAKCPFATPAKQ